MFKRKIHTVKPRRIIIGLGNPGDTYKGTRHNVGFETIDRLSAKNGIKLKHKASFRAITGEGQIGSHDVVLVKPQTYMNLSGESVREILRFMKLPPSEIIVVYDDVALPVGDIRIREAGSAGGQNGMKNIISCLGTDEFFRVRIGIGKKPEGWDLADYVLSRFRKDEWAGMEEGITKAREAVGVILDKGILSAMNQFNKTVET